MATTTHHTKITNTLHLANLTAMSEERYERMFSPLPNHFQEAEDRYPLHAALFDPHDKQQLQHVKDIQKTDPRRVWSLMDVDGQDVLVSGYQYATRVGYCRLGYVISQTPVNDGIELFVPLNKNLA